ncbi:MAG: hypothetical protein K0R75_1368 [Paenibacillaceae bacterium]|jgi:hypothetical protein|nr:hypothetical protein [Paenibacillaceae bacterium]
MDNYFFNNIMKQSEDVNTALRKLNKEFQQKYDELNQ